MRTKKIGLVSYDYSTYGGQGRFTIGLRRHLAASADIQVRVLSPVQPHFDGDVMAGRALARLGRNLGFSLAASVSLRRWRDRYDIDLFHLNGGPGGVLLSWGTEQPIVYTAHHTYAQQARLVPGQGWKSQLAILERLGYKSARAIAADTRSTAESLVEELSQPRDKTVVIPCGVDGQTFRPLDEPKLPGTALFVGRLEHRKGFLFLMNAWCRLAKQDPSATLYVIGDGPERPRAEAVLAEHGLGASVVFLGRVNQEDLVAWYNRVSCVVIPSVFEGFGLVAVEALACGTPVVATDSEGLRDVIEDGTDGRLVAYGDIEAMGDALGEALAAGKPLSDERREAVRAAYAWPQIATRYEGFYKDALAASRPNSPDPAGASSGAQDVYSPQVHWKTSEKS